MLLGNGRLGMRKIRAELRKNYQRLFVIMWPFAATREVEG